MVRIHIAKTLFTVDSQRKYDQGSPRPNDKPRGFWYGFGFKWLKFCTAESGRSNQKQVYKVCSLPNKMLKLNSLSKVDWVTDKYGIVMPTYGIVINWKHFSSAFNGVEVHDEAVLNLWQKDLASDDRYGWLKTWDIPSGCVWNLKDLKLKYLGEIKGGSIDRSDPNIGESFVFK